MDSIGYTITCTDSERDSNGSLFYFILYGVANREAIVSARDADYHSRETLTNHGELGCKKTTGLGYLHK